MNVLISGAGIASIGTGRVSPGLGSRTAGAFFRIRHPAPTMRRLRAPPGLGAVQTFSGRHLSIGPEGPVEMSAEGAEYLIRAGWTKIAEWTREEAA
jgi:hypothetical protein